MGSTAEAQEGAEGRGGERLEQVSRKLKGDLSAGKEEQHLLTSAARRILRMSSGESAFACGKREAAAKNKLEIGMKVQVHSLLSQEFNGVYGKLVRFNVQRGRWDVYLNVGGSFKSQMRAFKSANLKLASESLTEILDDVDARGLDIGCWYASCEDSEVFCMHFTSIKSAQERKVNPIVMFVCVCLLVYIYIYMYMCMYIYYVYIYTIYIYMYIFFEANLHIYTYKYIYI